MDCTFRRLTAADLEAALEMNSTFRPGFITEEGASAFFSDDRNWLWAGMTDNHVVAFAYGYALHRLDGRKMLYLHEVGVAAVHQQQGIGTQMLQALKHECRELGFHRIFLITNQSNAAANALYRKCGGEVSCDSGGNDTVYMFFL
nr:GNAT family N-acetyltransferase [Clostridia bacterium]